MINTKDDWVQAGLKILRVQGINAVKVEALARKLGVSKGGFYGYFLNRDALLQAMLNHWETVLTDEIIGAVSAIEGSLAEKLGQLLTLVNTHVDEDLELALIAWSIHDKNAEQVINRIVRRRVDFMKSLFLEEGFSEEQSELRARLMHSFNHGDRAFAGACEAKESPKRQQIIDDFVKLMCTPVS
ncbi:MAG: TetR/AcrR family transcriptional regulator [Desulfuromonadales bacterium]|nr:TetR/AcrR family transcriptional regulator [Desulfuromonadales bacterium]